ncbi:GDSL-type esterase/lipase family protein [Pseudonocardia acaciae]|uniref:GDSL-type esterase/lipase family protein n=1 Tax=Pseudonocardia acaciae TaxID=551276 RepID=UPI00055E4AF8|nr:GDSL-type esterase/lipase family protein [Pseudonocardia acaciae]
MARGVGRFLVIVSAVLLGVAVPGTAGAIVPAGKQTAIVALGDSSASGEGAGDYEPGTRGERGDWCHRSSQAYVRRTGLASTSVNLACSGAASAHVGFGSARRYTERSQAQRLVEVARAHRVTAVVAQLGVNDDPGFGPAVVRCVAAYLNRALPGCSGELGDQWRGRLAAMAPKVEKALGDVRAAMRQAGYRDQDYTLVLASYPSPVTESMVPAHGLSCPIRVEDARWGRTVAVPQLSAALAGAAEQSGARFLDLSRAAEGREACTSAGPEWQRRLAVNPEALVQGGAGGLSHLAQESFHLNAAGHGQVAGCLAEFVRGTATKARCLAGKDGRLHAVANQAEPARAGR